jgi:hypothetical protein
MAEFLIHGYYGDLLEKVTQDMIKGDYWAIEELEVREEIMGELEDGDGESEYLNDILRDELTDSGIIFTHQYNYDIIELHGYHVTYFDEYGVEHKVEINLNSLK